MPNNSLEEHPHLPRLLDSIKSSGSALTAYAYTCFLFESRREVFTDAVLDEFYAQVAKLPAFAGSNVREKPALSIEVLILVAAIEAEIERRAKQDHYERSGVRLTGRKRSIALCHRPMPSALRGRSVGDALSSETPRKDQQRMMDNLSAYLRYSRREGE